jgi:cytochrome P450
LKPVSVALLVLGIALTVLMWLTDGAGADVPLGLVFPWVLLSWWEASRDRDRYRDAARAAAEDARSQRRALLVIRSQLARMLP